MKVKDSNGNVVKGIVRNPLGSLNNVDVASYEAYELMKQTKERDSKKIESLERELNELKELVKKLIS